MTEDFSQLSPHYNSNDNQFSVDPTADRITAHIQLGHDMIASHSPAKAIEQFRAALSLDPENAEAHAWMGLALSEERRFDAALHEADLALASEPNNSLYVFIKGLIYAASDSWKEAEKQFSQAIEMMPHVANYHAHLAQALYHQEKKKPAAEAAELALSLDPEDETALLYLGFCQLDANKMGDAQQQLQRALELDPDSTSAHNAIGLYYLQNKQNDKALYHIREALRLNPDNAAAQHNLVLAMGAKNWFYGLFWKWSLFLSRFSSSGQIAVIIGAWAFMQALKFVGRANPELQPAVAVIGICYFLFCIYTWTAPALFRWWLKRKQLY